MKRRTFLRHGLGAIAAALPRSRAIRLPSSRQNIRFGYAAITWGGEDRQAIDDIAAVGFRGIQLRASAVEMWGDRPDELKDLLGRRGLSFVALSSGTVRLDPAVRDEELALHVRNARFMKGAGGSYLQVLDERPHGRSVVPDDYRRLGALLTDLGRRTADLGIPLGYHNHMGSLGQAPEGVARIIDATDPRYVRVLLDVAHYTQGGGDAPDAVRRYGDRLLFLHIKDVESPVPGRGPESYRFVELGAGKVDLPAVFAALEGVGFSGWAIVELDSPVAPDRTARASAEQARTYIEDTLHLEV